MAKKMVTRLHGLQVWQGFLPAKDFVLTCITTWPSSWPESCEPVNFHSPFLRACAMLCTMEKPSHVTLP